MKKSFKHVILALTILCSGGVVTSCDSDAITPFVPVVVDIIKSFFNTGQTYEFTGSATSQSFTSADNWETVAYLDASESNPKGIYEFASGVPVSITCNTDTTATLTLPTYSEREGGVTVTGFTLGNLNLSISTDSISKDQFNTLEISEANTTIDGKMTYDGVIYKAYTAQIEVAKATDSKLELDISMYFQGPEDAEGVCSKGVRFKFTGTKQETSNQ